MAKELMRSGKTNFIQFAVGVIFLAAGLAYIALGADIVPDGFMGIVGYLDDGVVIIALWLLFKRARKHFEN
jgi:uncharacterized membrane protein YkvA (DUF1232 family)